MAEASGTITVAQDVVSALTGQPSLVVREWLVRRVTEFRDSADGRHLIIVGEPGSGKTTFIGYLAAAWGCPRHFIRVNNMEGVAGTDARAFLVSIGTQLYQKYGRQIFEQGPRAKTDVFVGLAKDDTVVVGRTIDELYQLPFIPSQTDLTTVRVIAATGESRVVGEHIRKVVNVCMELPTSTLLHVMLIDPCKRLADLLPNEKVVILIDALDGAAQSSNPTIVDVIPRAADAEFPPNLRFVMTSRRGEHLVSFRSADLMYLDDLAQGYWQAAQQDILAYIGLRLSAPSLATLSASHPRAEVEAFVAEVRQKSDGNFLYLYHFFNELASGARSGATDLNAIVVPTGLDEIYRYFAVEKIRNALGTIQFDVSGEISEQLVALLKAGTGVRQVSVNSPSIKIAVTDTDKVLPAVFDALSKSGIRADNLRIDKARDLGRWEEMYLPLLGVLAVAFEALSREQVAGFAAVPAEYVDHILSLLEQFLDVISADGNSRYRFYHASFADYLLDPQRNREYPLDGKRFHYQIASIFLPRSGQWSEVRWDQQKDTYPFRHLAAHLAASTHHAELYALIDRAWMLAQHDRTQSHRAFAADVELAIGAANGDIPPNLLETVRACLIYATLGHMATKLPPAILGILAQLGREAQAREYAALIQDAGKQSDAYRLMAEALLARGASDEALSLLRQADTAARSIRTMYSGLVSTDERTKALIQIARAFALAGSVAQALDIAAELGRDQKDAWGQIERALDAAHDREGLAQFVAALVTIPDQTEVSEALVKARQALTGSAVATAQPVKDAPHADARDLETGHPAWRVVALGEEARRCLKDGDPKRAAEFVERAVRVASTEKFADAREHDLAGLVKTIARAGALDLALDALAQIKDPSNNVEALWQALMGNAEYLSDAGDTNRAMQMVEKIADEEVRSEAWSSVINIRLRAGDTQYATEQIDRVLDAAESAGKQISREEALGAIASNLAQAGKIEEAQSVVGAIHAWNPLVDAQISIFTALVLKGAQDQAVERANELIHTTGALENEEVRARLLEHLAIAFARAKMPSLYVQALKMLESISDPWHRIEGLIALAIALAQDGDAARANDITDRALAVLALLENKLLRVQALVALAHGWSQAAGQRRAAELAALASEAANAITAVRPRTQARAEVPGAFAAAKAVEHAMELVAALDGTQQSDARRSVAVALSRNGDFDTAISIAEGIGKTARRLDALASVAIYIARAGDHKRALEVVAGVLDESGEIEGLRKSWLMLSVVQALMWSLEMDRSLVLAQSMDLVVDGTALRSQALSGGAKILAEQDKLVEAEHVLQLALDAARQVGRNAVFEVLAENAPLLGSFDRGEMLWQTHQAIMQIDSWWSPRRVVPSGPLQQKRIEFPNTLGIGDGTAFVVEESPNLDEIFNSSNPPIPQVLTANNRNYWRFADLMSKRVALATAYVQHPAPLVCIAAMQRVKEYPSSLIDYALVAGMGRPEPSVREAAAHAIWAREGREHCTFAVQALRDEIRGFTYSLGGVSTEGLKLGKPKALYALKLLVATAPNIEETHAIQQLVDRYVVIDDGAVAAPIGSLTFVEKVQKDGYTYEVYRAQNKSDALAFLKSNPVSKELYYLEVETPEGKFGRDISDLYEI